MTNNQEWVLIGSIEIQDGTETPSPVGEGVLLIAPGTYRVYQKNGIVSVTVNASTANDTPVWVQLTSYQTVKTFKFLASISEVHNAD